MVLERWTVGTGSEAARLDATAMEPLAHRPEDGAIALGASRWWRVLAPVSVLTLLALNILVSRTAVAPRTPWDEIGPLQMARLLAGEGPVAQMSGAGYYPGWAILLTPIWWISTDPRTVYSLAIAVVIVLAMLTVVPLTLLVRRWGLSTPQAVTVAALTLSLPARTVNADYVLSENLLAFLIAWAVLLAYHLWERPTALRTVLFTAACSAAYVVHARALAVLLAGAVWLVLFARRDWRQAILGLVLLVGGYELVGLLVKKVTEPLLISGFGQRELFLASIESSSIGSIVRVALTQSWGQLAGSFGLIAVGGVAVLLMTWRELRHLVVGPSGFVFGMMCIAVPVSVLAWSKTGPQDRFDAQVYTRYLDPFMVVLVAIGIAACFSFPRWKLLLPAIAFAVVDVGVVVLRIAPWANTWGSMNGPANSASILAWAGLRPEDPFPHPLYPLPGNGNSFWFWASVCIIGGLAVVALLRTRPRVLSAVALVAFSVLSIVANPSQPRYAPQAFETAVETIESRSGLEEGTASVDVDMECRSSAVRQAEALNWSGFWLAPRDVEAKDPRRGESYDSEIVIACADWPAAGDLDAKYVRDSGYATYQVWVLPGEMQDAMESSGDLVAP